jgi:hypothetical protein
MRQIDNLSAEANQVLQVTLADGTLVSFEFFYRAAIQRWTVSVARLEFEAYNLDLCLHPNLLRGYRERVPFGLAVTSTDGADPAFIDDFASGRIKIYVLDFEDVILVEQAIENDLL